MATIGFLGLGSMGAGMAARLVEAGHDVVVWNRSPGPVDELVALGARAAASPAEALATGTSFSMLANDAAVDAVLDDETLRAGAGGVHVCMASISVTAADRLAARCGEAEVAYVSAPVLGRPPVAAAGQLNVMAAGSPDVIAQVAPYLDAMGRRTWLLGDEPRVANVVKAAVNYDIIHALQAIGESIAIVEAHGVEPQLFAELLGATLFGGVVYQGYGDMIANKRFSPAGFSMALGLKDLGLAETVAAERGVVLPTAPVLRELFETAMADPELVDLDWSAVTEVTRRASAAAGAATDPAEDEGADR